MWCSYKSKTRTSDSRLRWEQRNNFLHVKSMCIKINKRTYIHLNTERPYRNGKPQSTAMNYISPCADISATVFHLWICPLYCGSKTYKSWAVKPVFSPHLEVALCPSRQPIPKLLVSSNHNRRLHLNAVTVLQVLNGSKISIEHQPHFQLHWE